MDRNINDLRSEFLPMALAWESDMAKAGLGFLITCTLRSGAEQDAAWAEGRTVPGPDVSPEHPMGLIVTRARAGESPHQFGLAFDFVVMRNGKPDWTGKGPDWDKAIALAQIRGMQTLRPQESAHLQHPHWKQLAAETRI